jgi:hypothetical protein
MKKYLILLVMTFTTRCVENEVYLQALKENERYLDSYIEYGKNCYLNVLYEIGAERLDRDTDPITRHIAELNTERFISRSRNEAKCSTHYLFNSLKARQKLAFHFALGDGTLDEPTNLKRSQKALHYLIELLEYLVHNEIKDNDALLNPIWPTNAEYPISVSFKNLTKHSEHKDALHKESVEYLTSLFNNYNKKHELQARSRYDLDPHDDNLAIFQWKEIQKGRGLLIP